MIVTGVNMCMLFVSNMDRSVAWYSEVLELTLIRRHNGFAVFDTGNVPLALHKMDPSVELEEAGQGNRGSGGLIVLEVEDYAAAKTLLESRGCSFVFENRQAGSVFGTFSDPDGNSLQILQPPS